MGKRPDRVQQLLDVLVDATQPISGDDLARSLGVSARSVREYVRNLNRQAGAEIVTASHRGYVLDREWHALSNDVVATTDTSGPQWRTIALLEHLLTSGDQVDAFALADLLYVSMPTLELDLTRARRILREHDLTLTRRRDELTVTGSETSKRLLLRHLLVSAWPSGEPARGGAPDPDYHLDALRELIMRLLSDAGLEIHEFALGDLAVHLGVALVRTRAGHHLPAADPSPLPDVIERITEEIDLAFGVSLDLAERQHLADLVEANTTSVGTRDDEASTAGIREAVERALSEMATEFLIERAASARVNELVRHVQALQLRARTGSFVHNPLTRPFKETHPLLHELAVQFARKLGAALGIAVDESEVGFLAFYLAHHFRLNHESDRRVTVQCVVPRYAPIMSGFHAAVAQAAGDQAYVGPPLTTQEVQADAIEADVVVTCVHLTSIPGVRTVRVSPVPTALDLRAIHDAVQVIVDQQRRQHVWSVLSDLISPDHYFSDTAWADRTEAITALAGVLVRGGYAPDWFVGDVLERERLSSTAFRDQFAIPHGLHLSAHKTSIAVLVSQRPLPWGDSSVHLVMLFAFEAEERRTFRDVFDALIGVLSSPHATARLIASGATHDAFMTCLGDLLLRDER